MFDVGFSEIIVIGLVMLLAIGPKELPGALRQMGRFWQSAKTMMNDARQKFDDALRESELHDIKEDLARIADDVPTRGDIDALMGKPQEEPKPIHTSSPKNETKA